MGKRGPPIYKDRHGQELDQGEIEQPLAATLDVMDSDAFVLLLHLSHNHSATFVLGT